MTSLQQDLADFFPDRYSDDNWKELIPEYIDRKITLYNELTGAHRITMERWKSNGCIGPEPAYPILSEEFAEACEIQSRADGACYRSLAVICFLREHELAQKNRCLDDLVTFLNKWGKAI